MGTRIYSNHDGQAYTELLKPSWVHTFTRTIMGRPTQSYSNHNGYTDLFETSWVHKLLPAHCIFTQRQQGYKNLPKELYLQRIPKATTDTQMPTASIILRLPKAAIDTRNFQRHRRYNEYPFHHG